MLLDWPSFYLGLVVGLAALGGYALRDWSVMLMLLRKEQKPQESVKSDA